jgi:DNA-binding PadR family transcriptional regulator
MDYTDREYWNGIIKMCLSKFFILRVLYTQPMHGYEIARTVAEVTRGCCTPTEGTIYPVLREFEEGGYVTSAIEIAGGRERKVYTLTPKGKEAFRVAVEAWREVTNYILEAIEMSCCSVKTSNCCGISATESPEKAVEQGSNTASQAQDNQRTIDIEFLYLDLDACTRCQGTGRNLEEALNEVAEVLEATGVKVNLKKIHVQTEEQALALGFVSSPTIRINGQDIQLDIREDLCESCGDLCGEDVDCRVWVYQGKEYSEAPKGMIIEAILKHVYGGGMEAPATKEPLKELPENLKRFFAAKRKKDEEASGDTGKQMAMESCCGFSSASKCCN